MASSGLESYELRIRIYYLGAWADVAAFRREGSILQGKNMKTTINDLTNLDMIPEAIGRILGS